MPPRKKPRLETELTITTSTPNATGATSPLTRSTSPDSPSTSTYASAPEPNTPTIPSATSTVHWTPDLLSSLFRSLIRAKPTGPHKHMHMLSIQQQLLSATGYHVPVRETWRKLEELYDLGNLDEREAGFVWGRCDDKGDWSESVSGEMRLPGVPETHGTEENESEEEEDEDGEGHGVAATARLWKPKDHEEAWFMEHIWKRRLREENSDVSQGEEEEEEEEEEKEVNNDGTEATSPAPSTAASTTKPQRATRQTRASDRRGSKASASETPVAEDERAEVGDSEEETIEDEQAGEGEAAATPKPGTRRSARSGPTAGNRATTRKK